MSLVACASIGTDPARTRDLVRVSDRRIVMGVEARIVTWASCEPIARALRVVIRRFLLEEIL